MPHCFLCFSHPWVAIPSCCHGYDGFSPSAFMLGFTGITLNYLCQCFSIVFFGFFYPAVLGFWLILFSLFPPTFLNPFHISLCQHHLHTHALRNGCSSTYCLQRPVLSHSTYSPGLYPCLHSCLLPAAAFEVNMNKN